jgi:hypothetical protein
MDQPQVETICILIEMNGIPPYVPFHGEYVTYAIHLLTVVVNHEILITPKFVRAILVAPCASIVSI